MKNIQFIKKGLVVGLLCIATTGFSQKNKIKIADKEFESYSYIDAREIYLDVVEDGYESAEIFKNLGDTYYFNSDYNNAAKWYQRLIQTFPTDVGTTYYYRAAQSLKSLGEYENSKQYIEEYIALGGQGLNLSSYKNDPNYIKNLKENTIDYILQKVSVNTESSDFGTSFYGDKIVFSSAAMNTEGTKKFKWNNQPFLDLFVASKEADGDLVAAQPLGGEVNSPYHESSAIFTNDGNTMYFTRSNYLDGKKRKDKDKRVLLKLYKASKNEQKTWSNIEELPFNSNNYSVAHPALSVDEKRLYFSSDMAGSVGMSDIWYVEIKDDNTYGDPVNLGSDINTEARESFPYISKSGQLYFSSDGRAGLGGYDVYTTKLDMSGMPTTITNMGSPINSNKDDFAFIFDEKNRFGYISSNRGGSAGSIDDEIYKLQENICEIVVSGIAFDKVTNEELSEVKIQLLNDSNQMLEEKMTDTNGFYSFNVDCEQSYAIRASKTTYKSFETNFSTPDVSRTVTVAVPLESESECPPNDLGCKLNLQPIYFDLDKSNIRPDAAVELAKILAAMRQYPSLKINIESHTDSRANDAYNKSLSERRAQATKRWLISKGIDTNRLTAKGYGESQLVNKCSNGVDCTEEEHQLNRRSMFIIQE